MHYTNNSIELSRLQMILFWLKAFKWIAIPVSFLICSVRHSTIRVLFSFQYSIFTFDWFDDIESGRCNLSLFKSFVFWFWAAIIIWMMFIPRACLSFPSVRLCIPFYEFNNLYCVWFMLMVVVLGRSCSVQILVCYLFVRLCVCLTIFCVTGYPYIQILCTIPLASSESQIMKKQNKTKQCAHNCQATAKENF